MKRVCIVVPPNLPMPPVKGGAIETLMQYIVEVNEEKKCIQLVIISLYSKEVESLQKEYKNAQYIYYKWKKIDDIKYFIFRCIRKVAKIELRFLQPYEYFVTDYVTKNNIDIFVNESADFKAFMKISRHLGRENCFAHLHSEFPCNRVVDATFGTIICVSEYIKEKWMQNSNLTEDRVLVLKNCVDKMRFEKRLSNDEVLCLRKRLGFKERDFVIYFCGRIIKDKGVLELINAVNSIADDAVKLMIIGSPNFGNETKNAYLSEVEQAVKNSNGRVNFTGYVDNAELYKFYSISDCSVVPSTYEDPAPLVPIETMMAGKALIITNTGGAPEYVDNTCAIIVEKENNLIEQLKEAILYLKDNPQKRLAMENCARKKSLEHTKEIYYDNFINMILPDNSIKE